jgi:hypothetical protein
LDDIERKWGTEEYENRRSRMYSICGEYDFVNHLGEKVIPEENTKYIKCNFAINDIARYHDIVSMFCDEDYNYGGMINTSIGTGATFVTLFTSNVWDEIDEMPDDMRASCQRAMMNLAEYWLSNKECRVGLNGEKATVWDCLVTVMYGLDAIGDAALNAVWYEATIVLADSVIDTYYNWVPSKIRDEIKKSTKPAAKMAVDVVSFININEIMDWIGYGAYIIDSEFTDTRKEYFEIGCNAISELTGIEFNAVKEIGDTLVGSWNEIISSSTDFITKWENVIKTEDDIEKVIINACAETGEAVLENVIKTEVDVEKVIINACVETGEAVLETGKELLEETAKEVENFGNRIESIKENFGEWGENLIHNIEIRIGTDFIKAAMNN